MIYNVFVGTALILIVRTFKNKPHNFTMPLFYSEYKILPNQQTREACMTYYAGMTKADDEKELQSVKLLGRWSTLGEARGFCIADAPNAVAMGTWLSNWIPMADIYTVPVLDDNQQRTMILGKDAEYQVAYDKVGNNAIDGESLYFIKYQFKPEKRQDGFAAFASMTQEMDEKDSGACTSYGRWHVPSEGCGYAIASAPSAADIYKWAYNWASMCDCHIEGVTTDEETRRILKSKPGFEEKYAALMAQMGMETGPHYVTATFTFKDEDKKKEFSNIIASPDGLEKTRAWPGNESIEVYENQEDPLVLIIQQKWKKKSDHASYLQHRTDTGMLEKIKEFGTLDVQHLGKTNY